METNLIGAKIMRFKLIFFFLLLIISSELSAQENQNNQVLSSVNGRFVFGQVSDFRRDQYLLDTQTGRLWQIVETENKQQILQPVLFSSIDGTRTLLPEDPEIQIQRIQEIWDKNKVNDLPEENKK